MSLLPIDFSMPKDPKSFIGQSLNFASRVLVMNFQPLVVLLEEEEEENRSQRLAAIQIGDTVEGTVKHSSIWCFVDIGGLHTVPQTLFQSCARRCSEGLSLLLEIDNIDRRQGSRSDPEQDPWITAAENIPSDKIFRYHSQSHRLWILFSSLDSRGSLTKNKTKSLVSTTRSWI